MHGRQRATKDEFHGWVMLDAALVSQALLATPLEEQVTAYPSSATTENAGDLVKRLSVFKRRDNSSMFCSGCAPSDLRIESSPLKPAPLARLKSDTLVAPHRSLYA